MSDQKVDVLTMEIEHVDVDALEYVVLHQGVDVQPRPSTLRIIQVQPACSTRQESADRTANKAAGGSELTSRSSSLPPERGRETEARDGERESQRGALLTLCVPQSQIF